MNPPQPTTDEQLQALRREFEEYWATCLQCLPEIAGRNLSEHDVACKKDRCWRSWLHAKGAVEK